MSSEPNIPDRVTALLLDVEKVLQINRGHVAELVPEGEPQFNRLQKLRRDILVCVYSYLKESSE